MARDEAKKDTVRLIEEQLKIKSIYLDVDCNLNKYKLIREQQALMYFRAMMGSFIDNEMEYSPLIVTLDSSHTSKYSKHIIGRMYKNKDMKTEIMFHSVGDCLCFVEKFLQSFCDWIFFEKDENSNYHSIERHRERLLGLLKLPLDTTDDNLLDVRERIVNDFKTDYCNEHNNTNLTKNAIINKGKYETFFLTTYLRL